MRIINKPRVSKGIAWSYGILVAFIGSMIIFFAYTGFFTPMGSMGFVASFGSAIVVLPIFLILRSLFFTRYVLTDDGLIIETTKLIGGHKRIPLNRITSIEKTLIPIGLKLFGASFHGGYYKIPVIGRAFLAITNFEDGLLIKTHSVNYIITPKDPISFKNAIDARIQIP